MKTQIVLFFVLLIAAIGCEKASLSSEKVPDPELLFSPFYNYSYTGDLPETQSHLKSATVTKTIKFWDASGIMEFSENGDCGVDYYSVRLIGEGRSSLMGKYQVLNTFCFDGTNPVGDVFGFLTAANGDEIHTQIIGAGEAVDNDSYESYYIYNVLGGTGRFEHIIEGEMIIYVNNDFVNFTSNFAGEGTLVFQYN